MAGKKPEFAYIKIETIDLGMMLDLLTYEEIGKMFSAIYNYVENDTDPGELFSHKAGNTLLKAQLKKQAKAKEAYIKTSELRQESGRKGGEAKARNAKAKAAEEAEAADEEADGEEITTPTTQKPKFNPPTLPQFKNYAKQLRKENGEDEDDIYYNADDYTAEAFFDELREAGWKINGVPITCRKDWESACCYKYACYTKFDRLYGYEAFAFFFRAYGGLTGVEDKIKKLEDYFDCAGEQWIIAGENIDLKMLCLCSWNWKKRVKRLV